MRIFIPTIGMVLTLAEDWVFPLHEERRNFEFSKKFRLGYDAWPRGEPRADQITPPAGTTLKIDRIYIRKGGADMKKFDSVSFWCNTHVTSAQAKKEKLKKGRFWANLEDVNRMIIVPPEG
jgi:hypothetical protein